MLIINCLQEVDSISAKDICINEQIRAKQVRLIGAAQEQLGVVPFERALDLAAQSDLDLVEISATSDPPVCRIMDYGKYRFEKEKKEKEARRNQIIVSIKEIQLTYRIGEHDYQTKLKAARGFLEGGDKVKATVRFKYREMAHTELGRQMLNRFAADCADVGAIDKPPLLEGRSMTMFIVPPKKQ